MIHLDQLTSGSVFFIITIMSNLPPPPSGDSEKAEKYLNKIIDLLKQDKLTAYHTDLAQFDPNSLQDHYRVDLKDYQIEVSHSKQPDNGKDSFIILFNNLKLAENNLPEKIILAYLHLTTTQFNDFKSAAEDQIQKVAQQEQEQRLNEVLSPIEQALEEISQSDNQPDQQSDSIFTDHQNFQVPPAIS